MILIISAPEDLHAQAVIGALTEHNQEVHILNLNAFPQSMDLSMYLRSPDRAQFSVTLENGRKLPFDEVSAVWWRRPQAFGVPPSVSDPVHRQFAMAEAATAFQGLWQASSALWVNNVVRDAAAAHKPWQLELARRVGLDIPETLITNNPGEAKAFWHAYPGEVIYKPFSASAYAWRETRILKEEEEAFAPLVKLAPVIFQRYVQAQVDLRVTAIGDTLLAAEAHSQEGEYKVDVRFNSNITYLPHSLPREIESKLLGLMRHLGLEYGAIDMRLTPEGRYVFLEVNPAGQFLYVENATGLPIAATLAGHLAKGAPSSLANGATYAPSGRGQRLEAAA